MRRVDIESYRKLNESFNRRMVCRIGVDCGLFVEMNYMVNAMVYCLTNRIKFQVYTDDANFGTGVGWREYFLPFCDEVHKDFHQRYNFHRMPSWRRILGMCFRQKSLNPFAWKLKKSIKSLIGRPVAFRAYGEYVLFSQDVSVEGIERCRVEELCIDDDYMSTFAMLAQMVWRLHPDLLRQEEYYRQKMSLPANFSGVQIRGGDKITKRV